jgi:polyphenol oxidase
MTHIIRPSWRLPPQVHVAITTRSFPGQSTGAFASGNLGDHVGDNPAHVAANRILLQQRLRLPAPIPFLTQTHGVQVADLDLAGANAPTSLLTADACVSTTAGWACAILTADCLPVLFCAHDGSVVAASHAGWRGLLAGVLENTVAAMRCDPQHIRAFLGPCIQAPQFEVGSEVRAAFVEQNSSAAAAFVETAGGKWLASLQSLATQRLQAIGLHAITGYPRCTYADPDFFSHRRDKGQTGRFASVIWQSEIAFSGAAES